MEDEPEPEAAPLQALLVVSFGGPEAPEDVRPFLELVTRGRGVPPERLEQVAGQYARFGGRSPINDQVRALLAAVREELDRRGHRSLSLHWGNRNWHPFLPGAVQEMADAGVRHAAAFVTSAFSSYSGCRQYRQDIERAQAAVGPAAPVIDKLRVYFDHPGFVEPLADRVRTAVAELLAEPAGPPEGRTSSASAVPVRAPLLLFTAHSIPRSMADTCDYERQLRAAAELVAAAAGGHGWELVWQSRSGPPEVPWLEPDVGDRLRELAATEPSTPVVLVPLGFVSDHMEVRYDLDEVALPLAHDLGLRAVRAATVGTDPRFVSLVVDLLEERIEALSGGAPARPALSDLGVWPDRCRAGCCPEPVRPG